MVQRVLCSRSYDQRFGEPSRLLKNVFGAVLKAPRRKQTVIEAIATSLQLGHRAHFVGPW
jgi:hypothetical protein